jgi:hypothetical protein
VAPGLGASDTGQGVAGKMLVIVSAAMNNNKVVLFMVEKVLGVRYLAIPVDEFFRAEKSFQKAGWMAESHTKKSNREAP